MSGFTRIDQSTAAQWSAIAAEHLDHYRKGASDRIVRHLRMLAELELGFACNQLHHALMTGTLARRAGADAETIVTALCHDIDKTLSVPNHPARVCISPTKPKFFSPAGPRTAGSWTARDIHSIARAPSLLRRGGRHPRSR